MTVRSLRGHVAAPLAAGIGVLTAGVMLCGPASAAGHGPRVSNLQLTQVPRTGSVQVTATISCPIGVTHARWRVSLSQREASASESTRLRCDGYPHRVHLLLDPRTGRFDPGRTALSTQLRGCDGDLCWEGIGDGYARISPPPNASTRGGPPATAAAVGDVPRVRVRIRSVTLDGYSGTLVVTARVKCTRTAPGVGTAAWSVRAVQERRARSDAPIRCDGTGRWAVLELAPRNGQFHHGQVQLTVEQTARGSDAAEVSGSSFPVVV